MMDFDIIIMKVPISRAVLILPDAHFKLSIKSIMILKPHIERKKFQLCNRNEHIRLNCFWG
jgi:hypothetical protein